MLKKLLSGICACAVALTAMITVSASAADYKGYEGSNIGAQNYYWYWSQPVQSYLVPEGSRFMRVQGDAVDGKILVEYFNSSYQFEERKLVNAELPIFGAFYSDTNNYYILSGKTNPNKSDSAEVFRITKYDKSWKRLSSCSLYGVNTTVPFDAGSARMDHDGKYLFIRTCHSMYNGHQANVTIQVETSQMKVTDYYTDVMNSDYGYVSHSFNQFVIADNGTLIALDHGDAYPRSLALLKYDTNYLSGTFVPGYFDPCKVVNLISIPGDKGDNYTGLTVGGFEKSSTSYLAAGTYNNFSGKEYNVYVVSEPKTLNGTPKITWLTSGGVDEDVQFVKINDSRFLVLWVDDGKLNYAEVDADGKKVGSTHTANARLSDCAPVVSGGKVMWYTWEDNDIIFYGINTSDISKFSTNKVSSTASSPSKPSTPTTPSTPSTPSTPTAPNVPKMTMTKFTSTTNAVRVNWNTVSSADGYILSCNDGSGWEDIAQTSPTVTTCRHEGLQPGKVYRYRIRAYVLKDGTRYLGDTSAELTTITKPSKVTITKASKSSSAVRLYWNAVNCSGYKIQKLNNYTGKWETVKLVSSSKTNYRISGLNSDTVYKFRIQAYSKSGSAKAYASWSNTKKATTKK